MKDLLKLIRRKSPTGLCILFVLLTPSCSDQKPNTKPSSKKNSPLGFERDIKGIVAKFCFKCHGAEKTESGLDLRTIDSILKGGESGPAIVSEKPKESLLFELIHDEKMPPEGDMPGTGDIKQIREWIASGVQP